MMKRILAAVLFALVCLPAYAQWQTPNHSVPVGIGTGTGFHNAAPGTAGFPLTSNGASTDPTFQALSGAAFSIQSANTVFAGPTTGAASTPVFRALVESDLPPLFTGTNHAVLIGNGIPGFNSAGPCAITGFLVYNTGATVDPICSTAANVNASTTGTFTANAGLTSFTSANGINIGQATITRNNAAGNLSIITGTNAGSQIVFSAGTGVNPLTLSDTVITTNVYNNINLSPAYTLAAGVLATTTIVPLNSPTQTVAANKEFDFFRLSQADGSSTAFTIGASSIVQGFSSYAISDAGSDATSNIRAVVGAVTTAGPGTAKAIYGRAGGSGTSTGVVVAFQGAIDVVATTDINSGIYFADLTSGPDDVGNYFRFSSAANVRARSVFSSQIAVKVNDVFYDAWVATGSGASVRALRVRNNAGTELGYIGGDASASLIKVVLTGSSSGSVTIKSPAIAGSNTLTFPAGTTDFSGTSGIVQQASSGAAFTVGSVALASLATQATNTVVGNATSGTAVPTALAVGSCSTAASALIWTTNTGFGCNTSITAAAAPVSGLTGAGTNVLTWLATPSSANLAAAITDKTGTGVLVFGTAPTITATLTLAAGTNTNIGLNMSGIYTPSGAANAVALNFGLTLKPGNGLSAFAFSAGGITMDTSNGNLNLAYGVNIDGASWSKGGTNTINEAVAIFASGPTIGIANYAIKVGSGILYSADATDSTSVETGSIHTAGGLGVAKNITTATLNVTTMANAATTSAVCYNTGTGLLTYNATVGTCTVSTLTAKNLKAPLTNKEGFDIVMAMEPWRYEMKKGLPTYQSGEQIGMIAEFAEKIEPRLVAMNDNGTAAGFRYEQYTAALTSAFKYLNAAQDNIDARLTALERKVSAK